MAWTGLYPNDTWSGPTVDYVRRNCTPGVLQVALHSDASLFRQPQTVVASVGGRPVARVRFQAPDDAVLRVPLEPKDGVCRVRFDVSPDRGSGRTATIAASVCTSTPSTTSRMRIAVDVSPLSHPPTGIGNYIRGSLAGLAEAAGGEHEIVAFAPTSLKGPARIREALAGIPVATRLWPLPASHAVRTAWSIARRIRPPSGCSAPSTRSSSPTG